MTGRFRQWLIGIILLGSLLLGLAPKVIGLNLRQSTVDRLFSLIPPDIRQQVNIAETRFESGWFTSAAEFDIAYSHPELDQALVIRLAFDFSHGPLLLTAAGTAFGLARASVVPSVDSREFAAAMGLIPLELPNIEWSLLAGFDRSLTIDLAVAGMDLEHPSMALHLGGLAGNLHAASDRSAELQVAIGSLQAELPDAGLGFHWQAIEVELATEALHEPLAQGRAELRIVDLAFAGPMALGATDILAESRLDRSERDNGHLKVFQGLKMAGLTGDLPLEAMEWTLEIDRLSPALIHTWYDLLRSMQAGQVNTMGDGHAAWDEPGRPFALLLARNSLMLDTHVSATVYSGQHSLDVFSRWAGLPGAVDLGQLTFDDLVSALHLQASLSLDLAAVQRSPFVQVVESYVQQGYLQQENGRVLLALSLADKELVLNGVSTPIEQFFMGGL